MTFRSPTPRNPVAPSPTWLWIMLRGRRLLRTFVICLVSENFHPTINSLGVILYEICTGVPPFRGENIAAIMGQHISFMPTSPTLINPNTSPPLAAVIMRCLAKHPSARFSSSSALVAALAEALNLPIPAGLSQPTYPLEEMYGPTYFSPLQSGPSQAITPSSPPSPIMGSGQLLQSASASHPQQIVFS